jgi:NADPH:quinone reductase-like Zn-dependent oxidoreductase
MKAVICTKYGPPEVLKLAEVEKPFPNDNEILIKVHATTVTASDCIVRGFKLSFWRPLGIMMGIAVGFSKPRNPILGMMFAGEIEAVGKNIKNFRENDQVYGSTFKRSDVRFGAYAQYLCLPEDRFIAFKPANLSYEEAASIPYGALLALFYLRKGNIRSGQNILVYGASGSIGTMAVQFAKHFGTKVTGVCSTANLEFVKALGADEVIDYTKNDIMDTGETYDLILDAVGKQKDSIFKIQCKKALASQGKYISVDYGHTTLHEEDKILISKLVENGKLKPVIDRSYTLEQIVEAHKYVDKGHKKGNVVITVSHTS